MKWFSGLTTRRLVIFISAAVFLAIVSLVYFLIDQDVPASDLESSQSILAPSSSKVLSEDGPSLPIYVGQSIEYLGNDSIIKQFPEENVERQKKFLREAALLLKEKPDNFDTWVAVGVYKKFFNNFAGARDAWEYAKVLNPEVILPYLNLGNLYAYYLRDFVKAESNFFAATQRDSQNAFGSYNSLADFYRDFGPKDKAIAIYKKVLALTPNDTAVKTEIERLQKSN